MRAGRSSRAHAITNSPFVRALIRPVRSIIPDQNEVNGQAPPPKASLIPTQPEMGPVASTSTLTMTGLGSEAVNGAGANGKRSRSEANGNGDEWDAVQTNYDAENLPDELKKYWFQRYRLFSLFDQGVQMDREGWFSVTPEKIAQQIAERCRCNVIVDAFCGVGGNAIQFAFTCEKVIAIDISPTRLACARKNAEIYGVADRIEFIQADFVEWAKEKAKRLEAKPKEEEEIEVVFLSPPWGGIDYLSVDAKGNSMGTEVVEMGTPAPVAGEAAVEAITAGSRKKKKRRKSGAAQESNTPATPTASKTASSASSASTTYPLSALAPLPGQDLYALSAALTPHIAMFLPRNVDLVEVAQLAQKKNGEYAEVEIEEEWMGYKLKAITAYFGGLTCNAAAAAQAES
ncbi:BZ3500_MvSof-1268-A1-R1_Chr3-2g06239 [Microbotryum saponariae]|uniref:Trimethylguanosine synthase n=1 Tax=Microbotryum saponariae TaxID=289078 RepID=A0A2X0L1N8_9BASI|nr:BZ3500_MvSof-1268-A1-R1_Chr3-2g06239 [Microbotryum saponariae]SDA04183.1 BZ3501_MvSof-1269-A2-R1_Chr3-2g05930 [Microbotryum saponariae]